MRLFGGMCIVVLCAAACGGQRTTTIESACAGPIDTSARASRGTLAIRAQSGPVHHVADNAHVRAFFVEDRVRLVRSETVEMHLVGFGRDALAAVSPARIEERGSELRLVRANVTEWYANDSRGLEQGFDVASRPDGAGELSLELAFDAAVTVNGAAAYVGRGADRIQVSGLAAHDAAGHALKTRLEADGARLRLRIDDRDATYPVVVDPWYGAAPIKLAPSDTLTSSATALYLDGDTAMTSDPNVEGGKGAAYVFARTGPGVWPQQAKVVTTVRNVSDKLGNNGALLGDTIALSSNNGTVAFARSGTTWTQQSTLSDIPNALRVALGDGGNLLIHAAPSGVHTWTRSGATWSRAASGDLPIVSATAALDGKTLVFGVSGDSTKGTQVGAAPVYVFDGSAWNLQTTLYPSDAIIGGQFGSQVAIHGDVAAIATAPNSSATAIYLFTRSGTTWTQTTKVTELAGRMNPTGTYNASHWIGDAAVDDVGIAQIDQSFSLGATGMKGAGGGLFISAGTLAQSGSVLSGSGTSWVPAFALESTFAGITMTGLSGLRVAAVTPPSMYVYELGAALPNGGKCTSGAQCMSGFCIDSVCCTELCKGPSFSSFSWPTTDTSAGCWACTAAIKGTGVDGVCEPIVADLDPHDACAPDAAYPASCKNDGFCDGKGACRAFAKAGTACGATTCATGSVTGLTCNGAGSCISGTTPCAPYKCGAMACTTTCATDDECDKTAYCASSACVPKLASGKACTGANQCDAGYCVDGVCCESACSGQCQSCNESGTAGKCATVTGAPRGARPKCVGDPAQCGGACDGVNPGACAYAVATKSCGKSCTAGKASKSTCDGAGNCADPVVTPCGAYACAGDVCGTACSADSECTAGYACKLGACVPAPKGTCSGDRSTSVSADGTPTNCGAYLCDPALGTCLTSCGASSDCASGYICDNKTCNAAPNDGGGGSSGGCSTTGARSGGFGLATLMLLGLFRKRR